MKTKYNINPNERFDVVLDRDEKVIEAFRPDKRRFIYSALMTYFIIALLIVICASLAIAFLPDGAPRPDIVYYLIPVGVAALGFVVTLVLVLYWYRNVFYCYTNQRIIIRCGLFGVYYRCLDLKTIGAIDVSVNLWDKLFGRKTGSIRFGSLASPMVPNSGIYAFEHISNPYDTYKKIKDIIDLSKQI